MTEERPQSPCTKKNYDLFLDFLDGAGVIDDAYAAVKLINGLLFVAFPDIDEQWFISKTMMRSPKKKNDST